MHHPVRARDVAAAAGRHPSWRSMRAPRRTLVVGSTLLLLGVAATTTTRGGAQDAPGPVPTSTDAAGALHTLVASHYATDDGWSATLTLNNKGPEAKRLTPTLYAPDGRADHPDPVLVPGEGFVDLDLGAWVHAAGDAFRRGA